MLVGCLPACKVNIPFMQFEWDVGECVGWKAWLSREEHNFTISYPYPTRLCNPKPRSFMVTIENRDRLPLRELPQ